MDITPIDPPRRFAIGAADQIIMSDCARVMPEEGELVTITAADGKAHWPVVRRRWGFALPLPLDRRTTDGMLAVLSGKDARHCHLLLYRQQHAKAFQDYERQEQHRRFRDLAS
jgi:hypothetical protein